MDNKQFSNLKYKLAQLTPQQLEDLKQEIDVKINERRPTLLTCEERRVLSSLFV